MTLFKINLQATITLNKHRQNSCVAGTYRISETHFVAVFTEEIIDVQSGVVTTISFEDEMPLAFISLPA